MDDLSQWIKQKAGIARRRGGLPWWAWALAAISSLTVLVGWLIRKRAIQVEPALTRDLSSPKVRMAANTPVEYIAPVVQEIPLPAQGGGREQEAAPTRMPGPDSVSAGQVQAQDDLKIIEGIGPVIAGLLQKAGITTFAQLAETDLDRLEQILRDANLRISDPATWADQARLAADGNWDGLRAMQEELKGGRRAG